MMRRTLAFVASLLPAVLLAGPLAGQAETLGQQTLGRPYWHVFIAYAIAWILIFGWIVSIARRLGKVEKSLQDQAD